MHFYKSALPRCRCGKPAEYEVRGSGNERYDHACKRCADRRVRELTEAHKAPPPTVPAA